MAANLDKKMLNGFSREVKSYLPSIREGIENFQNDSSQNESLEETLRYIHTIKGASALMGLSALSQIATYIEELLSEITSGNASLDSLRNQWLALAIEQIDPYLECLLNGEGENLAIIEQLENQFLQIKHNTDDVQEISTKGSVEINDSFDSERFEPEGHSIDSLEGSANSYSEGYFDSSEVIHDESADSLSISHEDNAKELKNDSSNMPDTDELEKKSKQDFSVEILDEKEDVEENLSEPESSEIECQVRGDFEQTAVVDNQGDNEKHNNYTYDSNQESSDCNLDEAFKEIRAYSSATDLNQSDDLLQNENSHNAIEEYENISTENSDITDIEKSESNEDSLTVSLQDSPDSPNDHSQNDRSKIVFDTISISEYSDFSEERSDTTSFEAESCLSSSSDTDIEPEPTYENQDSCRFINDNENPEELKEISEKNIDLDRNIFPDESNENPDKKIIDPDIYSVYEETGSNLELSNKYDINHNQDSFLEQLVGNSENDESVDLVDNLDKNTNEDEEHSSVEIHSPFSELSNTEAFDVYEKHTDISVNLPTNDINISNSDQNDNDVLESLIENIDTTIADKYKADKARIDKPSSLLRINIGQRYLMFTVGTSCYAATVSNVLEIGRVPVITPVPNVPKWLPGLINLRGDILSVIDLRQFLGENDSLQNDDNRLLVVKTEKDEVATSLVVDQVNGFIHLDTSQMEGTTLPVDDKVASYLKGIYEYEGTILGIIDLELFLQSPEVCQFG